MNLIDLKIEEQADTTYDLVEGDSGDLEGTYGFDTAILTSVLTDGRASESEVSEARWRRGWLGDTVPVIEGVELGSLLWVWTEQRKMLLENRNGAVDSVEKALSWLVDFTYAKSVEVSGRLVPQGYGYIDVVVTSFSGATDTLNVPIWKATINAY